MARQFDPNPSRDDHIDDLIAGGHAQQHPQDWSAADLDGDGRIENEDELEVLGGLISEAMQAAADAGDVRYFSRGRTGWFDRQTGRVVVHDPLGPGSAFIPDEPEQYWNSIR